MTDTMHVSATEIGVVRVFAVDLRADQVDAFETKLQIGDTTTWPIADALGADLLDPDHFDLFDSAILDDLGLAGLLMDGHGIPKAEVEPMRAQLEAVTGHVLILHSRAVNGTDQTLTPKPPLRWIGTFATERAPVSFDTLPNPDPSATLEDPPQTKKKQPSDAAMSGRIATLALLVMALLVGLMIWVAG
ncbi:hypothetical protein [Pseudooctadecabacter jejudonensis]|uniref:Uncharacterized protein n=1 Tax=Pseudooctadecabacter jejudonensis TaxID=1391910 RepID=A0A1Y5T1X2_9RHOB|nr:hypothetical protein [Pseudooctadecabacter jejudonensis]SLN53719.1 hypothetical protein PSJ8397_02798 [Pseudooctadecabacter jejudonensis]